MASVVVAGQYIPLATRIDGDPDTEHLAYASTNDWILVTFDDDFLSLVENSDFDHAGIIY
jgi:predicted nuclease of predicted toxin-antitoxin system